MPNGGKRPGAGRPKGSKSPQTLEKVAARELVRQTVTAALGPMLEAQIAHATGLKYIVVRNVKTGKFERVTKERMDGLLERGDTDLERLEIWDKDPSTQSFTELMNRALDLPVKPPEQIDVTLRDGDLKSKIDAARLRVAQKK